MYNFSGTVNPCSEQTVLMNGQLVQIALSLTLMPVMNKYELVIIGGGPIGIACGLKAKKAGLSYVILEKGCLTNSLFN